MDKLIASPHPAFNYSFIVFLNHLKPIIMGQGPSIQQMAEKEQAFRDYLTKIRGELEKDKEKDTQNLQVEIDNFYHKGGWEYKPMLQLDKVEVQQVSSWSLDNIVKMLNGVSSAIFGTDDPPEGVKVEKPSDLTKSMQYLDNLSLLLVSKAFSVIQGILETFATESSYKGQSITKVEVVAPGITLFVSIRSDVWKNRGFFNNDSIAQYLFIVRSYFSLQQAGDISKINDIQAYEELKTAFRIRISALSDRIANPETPFSAMEELDQELGFYANKLSEIQGMIESLETKKNAELRRSLRQATQKRLREVAQPA
ncbi:MAG: hypothetical protein J0H92_19430 [Sphingobacteriales bacterium]|nr:hypothetical protein [Sphingobacteriales bacterium]